MARHKQDMGRTGVEMVGSAQDLAPRGRWATTARVVARAALCAGPLVLGSAAAFASPAAAAGFGVANAFASYQPGQTTEPPVSFDTLTLASGGTASAGTLAITGSPISGTASANTSTGIITYQPSTSTTGTQTITFQLCEAGPTACQTATLTVGAATTVNEGFGPLPSPLSGYANYSTAFAALAPASVAQGNTFTESFAPAALAVPTFLLLDGIKATVNYLAGLDYILPVPAGATYVSGSAQVVGGDSTTAGKATVTYCTTTGGTGTCTATTPSSTFLAPNPDPYLELQLSSSLQIAGGSSVTVPTLVAQFTATGTVGTTVQQVDTEFDAVGNVTADGITATATLATYSVASSYAGGATAPPYVAYPLTSTSIITKPPAPTVTGVSPTSGPQGGGTSVTVTGTNLSNATAVDFGSTAGAITTDSATSLTATSPAGSGTVDITVTTPGGTSTTGSADQFTYVAGPTISAMAPSSGPTVGGTSVTFTGTNLQSASVVDFGTSAATITNDTATSLTATTPPGSGSVTVKVTTASGTVTSPTSFTYVTPPPAPTITSVSPTSGTAAGGTPVTITGTNLANATAVDFGTTAGMVTADTATSITVTTPTGIGTVNVTVTTAGGTALDSNAYTYNTPPGFPTVTGNTPAGGPSAGGTTVTVTGTNFLGTSVVDFGTQAAFFSGVTATSLTAIAPAGSGTVGITVTTAAGKSAPGGQFAYTTPAPTVTAVSPSSGSATGGTVVTITGTNFFGATGVQFGTAAGVIVASGTTTLSALSPAGSGTVDVTVTTAGGTSATSSADHFTYSAVPAPTITQVSPASGSAAGGTLVTVTGTNLSFLSGVAFGSQPAFFSNVTSTSFEAVAPAGTGTVDITATTAGGTSATGTADRFAYTAASAPAVTAVSPASGPTNGGTTVTITGTNLAFATAVDFGSKAAEVTGDSATSVTALSPAGTGTVDITVTTPAGTSATGSGDQFTYAAGLKAAPAVTSISPSSGPGKGGTRVTVTGTNLLYASSVDFGGEQAFFTDVTATSLVAFAPAGHGTVDVEVTTPAGRSAAVAGDHFTYTGPAGNPPRCVTSARLSSTSACWLGTAAPAPAAVPGARSAAGRMWAVREG
jgi:hypothetical protein